MTERRRDRPLSLRRPDGPPDSHEPPQDEDLVDDNVIDLRPYLTREIADARAAHLGGAVAIQDGEGFTVRVVVPREDGPIQH